MYVYLSKYSHLKISKFEDYRKKFVSDYTFVKIVNRARIFL